MFGALYNSTHHNGRPCYGLNHAGDIAKTATTTTFATSSPAVATLGQSINRKSELSYMHKNDGVLMMNHNGHDSFLPEEKIQELIVQSMAIAMCEEAYQRAYMHQQQQAMQQEIP